MCIIIRKPLGKMLKFEVYDNCISEHEDGVGIAYVHDNQIVVKKGLWKLTELFDEIRDIEEEKEILFHFRTASPGMEVSVDNCHPFLFESTLNMLEDGTARYQWAIVHNGRLSWRSTKEKSDTRHIIEDAIQPHFDRDPYLLDFPYGKIMMNRLINHATSDNNKMAILALDRETKTHEIHILNEQAGNVDCGTWFSNASWRWPKIQQSFNHAAHTEHGYGYGEGYEGVHNYAKNRRQWNDGYVTQSERRKKEETGTWPSVSEILKKRFPDFVEPDKSGWMWDFTTHDWYHSVTKQHKDFLSYRNPPYDPFTYRSIKNLRLKAKDPIPEIVVVPPIEPAPMGGNPFTPIQNQIVPIQTTIPTQTRIEVPRDTDVNKDNEAMEHLDKSGINVLCHEAKTLLLHQGYSQTCINKMKAHQKIEHLRDAMRYTFDTCREMDDIRLDECTISAIKSETLDRKSLYDDSTPPVKNMNQSEA